DDVGQPAPAVGGFRVEGREEAVRGVRRLPRQAVEEGRLAGVGVSRDRDLEAGRAGAPADLPRSLDLVEVPAQPRNAIADFPSIELQFLFAGAPAADSAGQTRQVLVPSGEPRQEV